MEKKVESSSVQRSGLSKTDSENLAALLEEQRKTNKMQRGRNLIILGLTAPLWVPGVFALYWAIKIFSH